MSEPHYDEIRVMLRQLDILELRLGKRTYTKQPEADQVDELLEKLRKVSSLAVEVNVSSNDIHVDGDFVGGDKVGKNKAGGDVVSQTAGRDMKGVAGGHSSAISVEENVISTVDGLVNAIEVVAEEVASSDLTAKEKQQLLNSLYWLTSHSSDSVAPTAEEIEEKISPLKRAARWVKDNLGKVAVEAGGALAAHWVVIALAAL
jgi:hypothetical protein